MSHHWYAVHTYPRHEKVVCEHLRQRSVERYLPLYTTVHKWRNGVKANVELPLFPGYLFVNIQDNECGRVLRTPSVASIVSSAGVPIPVSDFEIEVLRNRMTGLHAEPHPFISVGDTVLVKRGPLAGLEGILVEKKGRLRLVLRMALLMRAASVEIDATDVERVPQPHVIQ